MIACEVNLGRAIHPGDPAMKQRYQGFSEQRDRRWRVFGRVRRMSFLSPADRTRKWIEHDRPNNVCARIDRIPYYKIVFQVCCPIIDWRQPIYAFRVA